MKKSFLALLAALVLISLSSCSVPIISDFVQSDESLGKTNNTAVPIAAAMKEYLQAKNKEDLSLYGIEMILNSDGNGTVKLFYTKKTPEEAEYSDIYVAEVDSRTGHVERFSKADYAEDGLTPFELVKYGNAFDAATLPVDSEKAISAAAQAFSNNQDFHYDYVQVELSMTGALEQYEIRFISMLNDRTYLCMVDAVNGAVLESSSGALVQESDL